MVLADVAAPDECAAVVAAAAAALGGIDGLVLNVGIGLGRGMAGTTAAQWDQTFAVHARAHFLVAAAALAVLEPGSAIVFISSAASLRAATGIPAYDASKAALLGICRQVAREGMARGIRANLVVPSLVDTPLGRDASRLNPGRTARALPFGRQATAWEVAYAAVWLLSEESSYVNAHPLSWTAARPASADRPGGAPFPGLYHSTGSVVRPPIRAPDRTRSCSTGTASRISGKRASSWEKTACSSMRASGAPRQ